MKLDKTTKRLIRLLVVLVVFGGGSYFLITSYSKDSGKLPVQFVDSRKEAARISQKIVELTANISDKVMGINAADADGNYNQALLLINDARESNTEAYNQAFELSRQLQKLAESLSEIKSSDKQRQAFEAVAVELGLVSEFIIYTQSLDNFFASLGRKILINSDLDRKSVEDALKEVNDRAAKINALNNEFLSKMSYFDAQK